MTSENVELYQTVTWKKATPHQMTFGMPLSKQEAEETLEIAMKTGDIDGKVVPYRTEPGHYPKRLREQFKCRDRATSLCGLCGML
jgi:hypothetical protein